MNRAVFLDRDGTILEHVAYMTNPAQVRIAPGAIEALRQLRDAGFLVVIVSNQSLIARGLGTMAQAEAVAQRVEELFAANGIRFDSVKYCYDGPGSPTPRRKPNPGMLLEAAHELNIDLARSVMIGDDARDPQTGRAAGCGLNLLLAPTPVSGEQTVPSISDAAACVLAWSRDQ